MAKKTETGAEIIITPLAREGASALRAWLRRSGMWVRDPGNHLVEVIRCPIV